MTWPERSEEVNGRCHAAGTGSNWPSIYAPRRALGNTDCRRAHKYNAYLDHRTTGARMDLRAMRYFVAIIDHGSLTRAAEVVCVAQPALSQQLGALEAEFGVPLVHRGAKGVRPT